MKNLKIVYVYTLYLAALIFLADIVYSNFFEKLPPLRTEIYLQMLNPGIHQRSNIEGLFYELKPGAVNVSEDIRINSLGMRDEEVRSKKDGFRVLVLGDSIVFGKEVRSGELFTQVAEKILKEKGENVEILNCGVCGYNTKQEFLALKHRYLKLKPDLVIFTYSSDDMSASAIQYLPDDYAQKKLIENGLSPRGTPQNYRDLSNIQYLSVVLPGQFGIDYKVDRWLLEHSGIYRSLSLLRFKRENGIKDLQYLPNFLFAYDYDMLLKKIKNLSEETGFMLRFMRLPTNRQWDKKRFLTELSRNQIKLWDFDSQIDPEKKKSLNIWVVDPHLNVKGHTMAGEFLARQIEASFLRNAKEKESEL